MTTNEDNIGGAKTVKATSSKSHEPAQSPEGDENFALGKDKVFDFLLEDVIEEDIVQDPEFLKEVKRIGWTDFAGYPLQKTIAFSISRTSALDEHDGNNLTRYVNCIRRYINARNEVLVLDFIPNHEQKTSARVVQESGEACLINEIRIALNGVLAKQVRGNIYELHAINSTNAQMDVMTGHITRHGDAPGSAWHGDFAPTIKLGRIEPASELHISMIYMKPGRVFTNELPIVTGSEVKMPADHTYFLHNGFTKYEQPDMIDNIRNVQLRNPMTSAPKVIRLSLYPQPYMEPKDIVLRALGQLIEDLQEIADHIAKSRAMFTENPNAHYVFGTVSIAVKTQVPVAMVENGVKRSILVDELLSRVYGYDESLGIIIASNASFLDSDACLHASSHSNHPTKKETVIRVTKDASSESAIVDLLERAVALAITRTKSIIEQFGTRA
jgi:DNA-directed RNA polymerase subunit L